GSSGQLVKLEYSTDAGQSYQTLKDSLQYDKGMYVWDVPKDILTRKAKIILSDQSTDEVLVEGEYFIIKPYIITKVGYNGDLIAYDVNKDHWGFENIPEDDLWPQAYYNQIDYQTGEDPFTGNIYDQAVGGGVFASADSSDFPDWVSFVNAHGKNVCYNSDDKYIPRALHQWVSKKGVWKGSCFGIAISNALAFEKPYPFISQYPSFPPFADPITLMANDEVIPVITELFTHQYGKYEQEYLNNISIHKSPTETVEDIKNMLEEENVEIKTLSFYSNGLGGGHTINIYKLEQDTTDTNLYYVYVWDNSYADNLDAKIVVDVSHNGGIGFWDPLYGFNGWEGEKWFFIDDPANNYLNRAVLPKMHYNYSHFNLDENKLEICISPNAATIIEDKLGNRTGFSDDGYVLNEIPNSVPLIMRNGSTGPPYGYLLDIEDYSIQLNNFSSSESRSYFFTGNKTFLYQRNDAVDTQTDMLYFDDGISVSNPDSDTKIVKLVNIVSESDEKLFLIKSLSLAENDSIKIFNPDDNTLEIKSFGSEKNYQIELEFVSDVVSSRFSNDNVSITENTSHKLRPNWGDFAALGLEILVDEGNDGTIDDTLNIENQVVGVEEHGSNILPTEFNLEQNYPNPFNASTVIKYSIPEATLVNIKVFNILGEEVAELVNEAKQAGNYSVSFTADNLPSGIYFCRMTADQYKNVKKLVLIK
ncbi:MAG: T9SS type A sorting domain-containing protein, partial [Bacteroidota bacterium]